MVFGNWKVYFFSNKTIITYLIELTVGIVGHDYMSPSKPSKGLGEYAGGSGVEGRLASS